MDSLDSFIYDLSGGQFESEYNLFVQWYLFTKYGVNGLW